MREHVLRDYVAANLWLLDPLLRFRALEAELPDGRIDIGARWLLLSAGVEVKSRPYGLERTRDQLERYAQHVSRLYFVAPIVRPELAGAPARFYEVDEGLRFRCVDPSRLEPGRQWPTLLEDGPLSGAVQGAYERLPERHRLWLMRSLGVYRKLVKP